MDTNYYRYKWQDAEVMKKDKQNPLMRDLNNFAKKSQKEVARLLDTNNFL